MKKENKLSDLLKIIKKNPDSKESKSANAELNFLLTKETLKQNKIITIFTIIVGVSTIIQTISTLYTLFCKK